MLLRWSRQLWECARSAGTSEGLAEKVKGLRSWDGHVKPSSATGHVRLCLKGSHYYPTWLQIYGMMFY